MNRTKRIAGMMTVAVITASFLIIGCGSSPTGPLIAGDGDGINVPVTHTGGGPDVQIDRKGHDDSM